MNLTSIKLTVNGAQAWATVTGPLTSGMVGLPVTIEYDDAWDGLTKNLVCRCSPWGSNEGEIRTILNVEDTSTVAHEVMRAGLYLYLGVEGFSSDGKLVIPTTWAKCGKIEYGANTCDDPSTDPELPVWNQLQIEMEKTKEYVLTPEQAVNIQAYAQTATQAAEEARQAAEEARQAVESGLYYIPVVSQPRETALKFEFKPSLTGAPVPKPVTVELPVGSGTGGELTTAQINALHGMFKVCLFDDSKDVDGAISAFETAFGITGGGEVPDEPDAPVVTTYSVEYELVNVSSNNSVASVAEGASYSATLTAADGYTMDGATVTVTMGGADITADVYADGTVSIPAVTGDIAIIASAVQVEQEAETVLPADGLLDFFDLRNAAPVDGVLTGANGGILYGVGGTFDDYGQHGFQYSMTYNPDGEKTAKALGANVTVCTLAYGTKNCFIWYDHAGNATNLATTTKVNPKCVKTDGSASKVGSIDLSTAGAYNFIAISISETECKVYLDGVLKHTWYAADIANFAAWADTVALRTEWGSSTSTACAIYGKTLSDVEIMEVQAYFETLEVNA